MTAGRRRGEGGAKAERGEYQEFETNGRLKNAAERASKVRAFERQPWPIHACTVVLNLSRCHHATRRDDIRQRALVCICEDKQHRECVIGSSCFSVVFVARVIVVCLNAIACHAMPFRAGPFCVAPPLTSAEGAFLSPCAARRAQTRARAPQEEPTSTPLFLRFFFLQRRRNGARAVSRLHTLNYPVRAEWPATLETSLHDEILAT